MSAWADEISPVAPNNRSAIRPSVARRRQSGQSLVELAFLLPTFLLITLGVVDLGRAFYESIAIQGAADAGSLKAARYGQSEADVKSVIKASTNPDVFPFLEIQDSEISLTMDTSPTGRNSAYTVMVTRNFQLLTPLVGNVLGSQALTLRSVVHGRRNCSTIFC
jgi:Flp pilus assembly protein TadG